MLYINFQDGSSTGIHVGQINDNMRNSVSNIISIQADGDELNHIHQNFSNIPFRKDKRVVKFYGETAKFIMGNW